MRTSPNNDGDNCCEWKTLHITPVQELTAVQWLGEVRGVFAGGAAGNKILNSECANPSAILCKTSAQTWRVKLWSRNASLTVKPISRTYFQGCPNAMLLRGKLHWRTLPINTTRAFWTGAPLRQWRKNDVCATTPWLSDAPWIEHVWFFPASSTLYQKAHWEVWMALLHFALWRWCGIVFSTRQTRHGCLTPQMQSMLASF